MTFKLDNILFALAMVLTVLFSYPAFSSDVDYSLAELKHDVGDTFDKIGEFGSNKKDEVIYELDNALEILNARIDRLEHATQENWEELSTESKTKTEALLSELRDSRDALGEKLEAFKNGSTDAWDELSEGISEAWSEVQEDWQNLTNNA